MVPMRTIAAGTVSEMGEDGVDVYLMKYGRLPDYYVSKSEARKAGWKKSGATLDAVLPGMMIYEASPKAISRRTSYIRIRLEFLR